MILCGEVRRKGVSPLAKEKRLPPTRHLVSFPRRTCKSFAPLFGLVSYCFTYETRRGREWSRREPSDIDEPRRVSSRERANQSNQRVGRKPHCPTKPSEILRRGRESNPRIAVLQTAALPLGYPANFASETTVSPMKTAFLSITLL